MVSLIAQVDCNKVIGLPVLSSKLLKISLLQYFAPFYSLKTNKRKHQEAFKNYSPKSTEL